MNRQDVKTPTQALVYLLDCTLATVAYMAMQKSRRKGEYERQIAIAQTAIDWVKDMRVDPQWTRAREIIEKGMTVKAWATERESICPHAE